MTVLGWDAYPNKSLEEQGLLTYVTKEELLRKSDLISLHAPLVYFTFKPYPMTLNAEGKLLFNIIYASYYIALFPLALKFIGGREEQEQGLMENKR